MSQIASTLPDHPSSIGSRLIILAGDIKISHTVFAMPFALLSTFLAARQKWGGLPKWGQVGLILVCMVAARTVAMAANRLLDAELDAKNPRTARRAIPSGALTRAFVGVALSLCAIAFIGATALFGTFYHNWLPLILSVPVLLFLGGYPFLKRFTRLCHYYLGAALALAPVCAWIAIAGTIDLPPILMALAVLSWTAGFDIIYACQDYQSDLEVGVVSVPAKVGIAKALWISRVTHLFSLSMLVLLGLRTPELGMLYFVGVGCAAVLMVIEHSLVKPSDLSKVGLAFFTVNGIISVLLGTLGIIDVLTR
ncbi:MAG TPA: UbiA-like polyprenyltransferase [Tepidisphaeraceae bacterium]|nr:UbiA-like polyprenyltransferase [Tepidisphaeraceae bacterium]